MATTTRTGSAQSRAWEPRPRAAFVTRLVVLALPIVAAVAACVAVGRVVEKPSGMPASVPWFVLLFAVATVVLVVAERAARRLLPIATLLELTLAFPDRTPSRFAVALRAGLMTAPHRRLQHMVDAPHEEPVETVLALVFSLGEHDRRTRGHSERVRAYAEVIADELRLEPDERNRLRWSALLHDIGKLAVHPHVLQKDGPLDDHEWEQIRRHPEEGARLVAAIAPWLGEWAPVVAQHHERWDGLGYPAGLAGAEISLGGRIVAVADAFEVMTAGRTYAKAIASPAARAELLLCAGSQFDPAIVRAFLNAGIAPLGWWARFAAWLGAIAVTGRQPARDATTRVTTAMAAGVIAAALVGSVPSGSVPSPDLAAEVMGVAIERDAPPAAESDAASPADDGDATLAPAAPSAPNGLEVAQPAAGSAPVAAPAPRPTEPTMPAPPVASPLPAPAPASPQPPPAPPAPPAPEPPPPAASSPEPSTRPRLPPEIRSRRQRRSQGTTQRRPPGGRCGSHRSTTTAATGSLSTRRPSRSCPVPPTAAADRAGPRAP